MEYMNEREFMKQSNFCCKDFVCDKIANEGSVVFLGGHPATFYYAYPQFSQDYQEKVF